MPPPTLLTPTQLVRLIGLPDGPTLIDVRVDADFDADPRMLPGASRRDFREVAAWASDYTGHRHAVIVCQQGLKLSQGAAAWLRHAGVNAESLEGGFEAWGAADTARPDLAPEAPGLLAASLGLSRMYADDLAQLQAGLALYDAFYRWCRDATEE